MDLEFNPFIEKDIIKARRGEICRTNKTYIIKIRKTEIMKEKWEIRLTSEEIEQMKQEEVKRIIIKVTKIEKEEIYRTEWKENKQKIKIKEIEYVGEGIK